MHAIAVHKLEANPHLGSGDVSSTLTHLPNPLDLYPLDGKAKKGYYWQ